MGAQPNVLCVMGLVALLSTGCMLDRTAIGMCAPGPCADAGMGDAWVGDGDVHDAGTDAFMMVADGGDADLPDAFIPDSGMDAGPDAFVPDGGMDGGPPPTYLHIRYNYTGTTSVAGFIFRVAWNPGPTSSIMYTAVCDSAHTTVTATSVSCDADVPELMPTRTVDLEPVNAAGTPVCTASTCPGMLSDWVFTYGGAPVPSGSVSMLTGPTSPGPAIPGDPTYIRISSLPTP